MPGIVGLGKAVELAKEEVVNEIEKLTVLRNMLIDGILTKIEHSRLNGHPSQRLPNNVNISFSYVDGESMLLKLDMEGIACSTGSACTSSTLEPSHVLSAIGLPLELAHGSLRFSLEDRRRRTTSVTYLRYYQASLVNYVQFLLPTKT